GCYSHLSAPVSIMPHLPHLVFLQVEPRNRLLVFDETYERSSEFIEDIVYKLLPRRILLQQLPNGCCAERNLPALVGENPAITRFHGRQDAPEAACVDDNFVGGHRQDAFYMSVIKGEISQKGAFDVLLVLCLNGRRQLAGVPGNSFVDH